MPVAAHIKVEFPWASGLPDEVTTNTWNVVADSADPEEIASNAVVDAIEAFYLTNPGPKTFPAPVGLFTPENAVFSYFSPLLSDEADVCTISLYRVTPAELLADEVGTPDLVAPFTCPVPAVDGLPPDLHLALHFGAHGRGSAQVEVGTTRPKQRRTGHVKLGPLNVNALETAGTGVGRPSANFRLTAIAAASQLQATLAALTPRHSLAVWSRVDGVMRSVDRAWSDNAMDDVESRKLKPTARNILSIAPGTPMVAP